MAEKEFLDWLRRRFAGGDPSVLVGAGFDDCALVACGSRRLALSVDAFAEGSHFTADASPREIAAKAVRASLSDLAASGCRARWILSAASIRRGLGGQWTREFADSLAEEAAFFGAAVIGGDTVSAEQGTVIALTVAGEPLPGGPVLRSGARPGDVLAVTGSLGGSLRGRHLRPVPRFAEMEALLAFGLRELPGRRFVGAAMDISDGLALDLSRLCRESGVGAVIEAARVPISGAALLAAGESGKTPLAHALGDGEDFELLVAVDPAGWPAFSAWEESGRAGPGGPPAMFTRIGLATGEEGMRLADAGGAVSPLAAEGYEHLW